MDTMMIYLVILLLSFGLILGKKYITKIKRNSYKSNITLDNVPNDFEQIYQKLYAENIYSLEIMRKKVRFRKIFQYIFIILFFIGYIVSETRTEIISTEIDLYLGVIGIISFVLWLVFVFSNRKYERKYNETYKKEIVSNFIKLVNPELEYKPIADEIPRIQTDYELAKFDNKRFNRFYADDYIEGFMNDDIFIKAVDLHIQNETGSGRSRHVEEIFQGIFASTKCNKDIKTFVKISKNKLKILDRKNRVEMDSQEFEKYFDAYSENDVITMQLLTSDIMEILLDFYEKYKLDFEIVFVNNTIYLRFFTGPMFEPKIFGDSMDKELLFVYYSTLKFVAELTIKVNEIMREVEV